MLRERMGSTEGLRVVNLNSGSGLRAGQVATAYNLSKTALARLTGSTHLAGIPCLDLMPGVVRTDMTGSMLAHRQRTEWTDPQDVTDLVVAFGEGALDAWSGRFVRAGVDTPESLRARADAGLGEAQRMLTLEPWGSDDPLT
jgi:NAD(P)-dependent dehydrogenase (short-subunit alcohol dehydrogenase family)